MNKLKRVKPIIIAKPKLDDKLAEIWKKKAKFAEETGMGDHLCVEGYFGRVFRSDPAIVNDIISEYCDMHRRMCERFDKAKNKAEAMEVLCWNDLYRMLYLIPSMAGDQYGYVNSPDYRISNMDFDAREIDQGEWVDLFKEPFYYFTPKDGCYPDPCYLEY